MDCVRLTAGQVADLLETVYTANARMASGVHFILDSRCRQEHNVQRFTRLADELSPGAAAQAELAALDTDPLMAGMSLWMQRRRSSTASASAVQCWGSGQTV